MSGKRWASIIAPIAPMELPAIALIPLVLSRASISGGNSSVMKVSHLCSPSRGSGFSQSEYRLAIPPLSITTLTFLSAKNAGAPPIVIHPLLFSPASTPSSMYSAGRGTELSAGSKISTPTSRRSAGDATVSLIACGAVTFSPTMAGTTMSSRRSGLGPGSS